VLSILPKTPPPTATRSVSRGMPSAACSAAPGGAWGFVENLLLAAQLRRGCARDPQAVDEPTRRRSGEMVGILLDQNLNPLRVRWLALRVCGWRAGSGLRTRKSSKPSANIRDLLADPPPAKAIAKGRRAAAYRGRGPSLRERRVSLEAATPLFKERPCPSICRAKLAMENRLPAVASPASAAPGRRPASRQPRRPVCARCHIQHGLRRNEVTAQRTRHLFEPSRR